MVDKFCDGCAHLASLNTASNCCVYILDKGHKRPCPSGTGCTEHTGKSKSSRSPWFNSTQNISIVEKMFAEGKSDDEIARVIDRCPDTVARWRRKHGLDRSEKRKCSWDRDLAEKLYYEGKTDSEISVVVGATYSAVKSWRRKNGLFRKNPSDWDKELARKMFFDGKPDKEIADAVGMSIRCIEKFRWKEKLYRTNNVIS